MEFVVKSCALFVVVCALVKLGECGECCVAHTSLTGEYVDAKWCDNYCCLQVSTKLIDCCNQEFLQAPAEDREPICANWFSEHVWAPILMAAVVVAFFACVTCCCCCGCCGCCRRRQPAPVVFQNPGGGQSTVVVSNTSQMMNVAAPPQHIDPYRAGYDQP